MINLRPSTIVPFAAGIVMLCTAAATAQAVSYRLLATNKTSTMQKELQQAGDAGFKFVGVTVSKTAFGGKEIVSILRKEVAK